MIQKSQNELPEDQLLNSAKNNILPQHIAIIMDGNGRWAKERKLPRTIGHKYGVEILRNVIETSCKLKIQNLTLYAFSTENWKRPAFEVNALMLLIYEYLDKYVVDLNNKNIKLSILGDITPLDNKLINMLESAITLTRNNSGLRLNVALNYGSRDEILAAVKNIAAKCIEGKIDIQQIDDNYFKQYLYTKDLPDPDLVIRTGGESRLSNFLLYQSAYSELYFTDPDTMWPDFDTKEYLKAIVTYQNRDRRFGAISREQEL